MGVEAAVHVGRRFAQQLGPDEAMVKLDFTNAFNSIGRDTFLEVVREMVPEIFTYVHSSYSEISSLSLNNQSIDSVEGVQQGDPLGPILFCIAIHPLLADCKAELRIGYLDDITII